MYIGRHGHLEHFNRNNVVLTDAVVVDGTIGSVGQTEVFADRAKRRSRVKSYQLKVVVVPDLQKRKNDMSISISPWILRHVHCTPSPQDERLTGVARTRLFVKVNSPVRPAWQFCLKRLSGIARTRHSSVLKGFQALHEQDTALS